MDRRGCTLQSLKRPVQVPPLAVPGVQDVAVVPARQRPVEARVGPVRVVRHGHLHVRPPRVLRHLPAPAPRSAQNCPSAVVRSCAVCASGGLTARGSAGKRSRAHQAERKQRLVSLQRWLHGFAVDLSDVLRKAEAVQRLPGDREPKHNDTASDQHHKQGAHVTQQRQQRWRGGALMSRRLKLRKAGS